MDFLLNNLLWMSFNVSLAIVPIIAGWTMLKNKGFLIRLFSGIIWFFFLPNTIYLLTDFVHFLEDLQKIGGILLAIDLLMYISLVILGIITFILALEPFERMVFGENHAKKIRQNAPIIYVLNFFVGFGLVLGLVQRTNSWEIITNTERVIGDSMRTIKSLELMLLVIAFTILSQVVYIKFRRVVKLFFTNNY